MSTDPAEAKKPQGSPSVAQIHVQAEDGSVDVTLAGGAPASGRTVGDDPNVHIDPISTAWTPHLAKGSGSVTELTGYRFANLVGTDDVIVTYVLLIETTPGQSKVRAVWWENHMEVPTRLYSGSGTLDGRALTLDVADADGTHLALTGKIAFGD